MNTFLPYESYIESAKVLDYKRLGKQRVECLQLLNGSFKNHPCALMWQPYELELASYCLAICDEWISRGYEDTVKLKVVTMLSKREFRRSGKPPWLGSPRFHASHRSNLLRKDKDHYSQFGWTEPDNLPYFWPDPFYFWQTNERTF